MASIPPTRDEVEQTEKALAAACRKVDAEIPPAAARNRTAATGAIDAALDLARVARKSQSGHKLKAVRIEEPESMVGELTAKFQAFKPS